MAYMLGLDASLKKSGYVVIPLEGPDTEIEEKGLLKTSPIDGITILRLLKQQRQVKEILKKCDIRFVGMEAPFFMGNETEKLFALNQFLHALFLEMGLFVVAFPPSMLKKLTLPDLPATEVTKAHMIDAAKTTLSLHGSKLAEDVADGFWAGWFGRRFYRFFIEKSLKENALGSYEKKAFCGKHEFTRGAKKGSISYHGIIYRENDLFFDFEQIKRRSKRVTSKKVDKEKKHKKGPRNQKSEKE